jgi:predicted enzyme related to lactoylglutathione lyase
VSADTLFWTDIPVTDLAVIIDPESNRIALHSSV